MITSPASTACPCGAPRQRGFSSCDDCRAKARAADPLRNLDFALMYQLMAHNQRCCRCPALDHGPNGCTGCHRCDVTTGQHPDHQTALALDTYRRTATGPLADWIRDWHYTDHRYAADRPADVAGAIEAR